MVKKRNVIYISGINKKNINKSQTFYIKNESVDEGRNIKNKNIIKFHLIPKTQKLNFSSSFKIAEISNKKYFNQIIPKSCKNLRSKSAFAKTLNSQEITKNKRLFSPNLLKSDLNSRTINLSNKEYTNLKKGLIVQKFKNMKLSSGKNIPKIDKEDKELNKFFNKKYIKKRNYFKKLEDREYKFQKCVLKLKDEPKIPINIYNRQLVKQNAEQSFQKILSLLNSSPINWKENLSPKEIKKIKYYDKLENAMISSLDNNAFAKFKNEDDKQKEKSILIKKELNENKSMGNIKINNTKIINTMEQKIEELNKRENLQNKNYQKMLIKIKKHLKFRNHNTTKYHTNCTGCKYNSEKISPISQLKKFSYQD